jgi:tetratricopeptide (TPR) repeat protein
MKKIFLITLLTAGVMMLRAQSIEQGNKELYYERFGSAKNTFQQLINQNSENAAAWYGLTRTYLLDDKAKEVQHLLQSVPASLQNEPYYQVAMGEIRLNQGNSIEAANYFTRALNETRQKDKDILIAIAQAHISAKAGDAGFAIDLINKAIKRDKHSSSLSVLLGDAYLKQNNGSEAYRSYKEAVEKDDRNAAAYYKIGEIFLFQKNAELYVDYFKKAVAADSNYAPALYKLYVYEFYHDPAKAMSYYKEYISKSDHSIQNDYDLTDLLYVNKQYKDAIQKANLILTKEADKTQPRLFKLISYSYAADRDTSKAITYLQKYFEKQPDTSFMAKDFISMGEFYAAAGQDSLASMYFEKGIVLEKDSSALTGYYKQLAELSKNRKDFPAQAKWLGKYYESNDKANNLDLFNWGLACYRAEDYSMADTVFSIYTVKYPEQSFGFYWQAKSKALRDKDLKEGLAVDAYKKLIEVLEKNPGDANYKKWMIEAYGYLAAYEANTQKDYAEAKNYFEKLLKIDPENADAKKYINVLDKNLEDKGTK